MKSMIEDSFFLCDNSVFSVVVCLSLVLHSSFMANIYGLHNDKVKHLKYDDFQNLGFF